MVSLIKHLPILLIVAMFGKVFCEMVDRFSSQSVLFVNVLVAGLLITQ